MAQMQKSPRDGAASTSILEKGSPANKVLAVIMALVMAFTFIPLPGRSAQAYAKDDIAAGTSGDVTGGEAEDLPGIVVAPLVDHGADAESDKSIRMDPDEYEVSVAPSEDPDIYNVDITAVGVKQHYNGRHDKAYWVGIGIPAGDGLTYSWGYGEYPDDLRPEDFANGNKTSETTVDGTTYDTFYFGTRSTFHGKKGYVAVRVKDGDHDATTVYNISFENVKLVYDVTIDPNIKNGEIKLLSDATEDEGLEPTAEAQDVKPAGTATEGDFVKFKVTPDKHYLIDEVKATYVVKVDGKDVTKECDIIPANEPAEDEEAVETQTAAGEEGEEGAPTGMEFAVIMPAAPLTLSATFANIQALETAVAAGELLLENIVESDDGEDVIPDKEWATADDREPLVKAIDDAEKLIAGGIATQKKVDVATKAVEDARDALEVAAKEGKQGWKDAVDEALEEAQQLVDEAIVSWDGSAVRNTKKWVTPQTKVDLATAIHNVEVAEQGEYPQRRDEYYALTAAIEAFEGAMKPGRVDSSDLDDLIETLEEELDEVTIAEDPATVEEGETFYTPESAKALKDAIDAANQVSQQMDATQAEIDKAKNALYTAAEIFAASAQTGTKGSGIDISKAKIAKIDDQTYTTKAIEPKLAVTLDEKELVEGTDFTVSYKDNIEVGKKATATITGKGAYEGQATATFEITSPAKAAMASMPDLDPNAWYMGGDGTRGGYFLETNTLYLDYALARGLMSGYTKEGKVVGFGPNNSLKRAQAATVLYRMANDDISPTTDPAKYEANQTGLSDVEDHAYYTAAVNWAYKNGVMTGYTDDAGKPVAFGPDDPINREQIATTIGRWGTSPKGGDMPKPTKKASDLYDDAASISDWALEGAAFCNENGIMTGVGGTKDFNPKANTERCQMAKIIAVTDKLNSEK